ncbi:MAG: TIGR02996 domain-containing protein [Myxococcales bacterium]|nr:TIGR02996 domain-containing protein [Myxococcales bacterium]
MASVMAVISKAQFEAQHRGAKIGDRLAIDRYTSANKGLSALADGGALFLVTVRPPTEQLWLVAVLESPTLEDGAWIARENAMPVVDLAPVRDRLRFVNGKGLPDKAGALGMSLQTPRPLTDDDVALLRSVTHGERPTKVTVQRSTPRPADHPFTGEAALAAAEAALAAKDRVVALDALLSAWRSCRAQELAEVIDVVSDDAARTLEPIPSEAKELPARWTAVEMLGRAVDVPRLLPGLFQNPLGSVGERLQALLARGPDPRVGRALLDFVDRKPTTASSRFSVWVNVFGALPTMVDESAASRVAELRARSSEGGVFGPKYIGWLAKLRLPPVATLDEATRLRVRALLGRAKALAVAEPQVLTTPTAERPAPTASRTALSVPEAMAAAVTAMQTERYEDALIELLSVWERTGDKELADLVDALTLALQPRLPALADGIHAWLDREAEGRAADIVLLVRSFAFAIGELVQVYDRLRARPVDPRIGRAFLERAEVAGNRLTAEDHWNGVLDLLARHGEPSALANVESYVEREIDAHTARHFPVDRPRRRAAMRVVQTFRDRVARLVPLPADARARLGEIRALLPAPPAHPEAPLLAAIVAAPDDDGPRLVYADWLQERGDKLGEWIAVEVGLARTPGDRKLVARRKALTRTHADRAALIAPVRPILQYGDWSYERGMLKRIEVQEIAVSDRPLLAHPRFATVEEIEFLRTSDEDVLHWLRTPALPSLRRVRVDSIVFAALASGPPVPTLRHVSTHAEQLPPPDPTIADAPGLPSLCVLEFYSWSHPLAEWLLDGALGRRLERLVCEAERVKAWRAAVARRDLSIVVETSKD